MKKKYQLVAKDSKIHGKGLFADEDIPKGVLIVEYTGEWITDDEANRREVENDKKGLTYIFWYDKNNSIDGAVGGNESIYINHSCDPNCRSYRRDGKIFLKSIRPIKQGEELFFDYSFSKDDRLEKCFCGSKKCRGVMNKI